MNLKELFKPRHYVVVEVERVEVPAIGVPVHTTTPVLKGGIYKRDHDVSHQEAVDALQGINQITFWGSRRFCEKLIRQQHPLSNEPMVGVLSPDLISDIKRRTNKPVYDVEVAL